MADDFAEHLLRSSLIQMCKQQGWHQASHASLAVFSNLARHYLRNIGMLTLRYSLHGGRYEPNLDDVGRAFNELGIALTDLQNFWAETDSNSGTPQVCGFPVEVPVQLNIPDEGELTERPGHIPLYMPPLVSKDVAKVEDNTIKEDIVTEATAGPDPFDEAAAAPTPAAPNFPFVNKDELPEPRISSWGFQRVTINSKPPSNSILPSAGEKRLKTSPDNFAISENSDDFVFASKHSKSKDDSRKKPLKDPKFQNDHSLPAKKENTHPAPSASVFMPSLGTSTPLPLPTDQKVQPTGTVPEVDNMKCKLQLFESNQNTDVSTIEEELSGFVPELDNPSPVCPKTPTIIVNGSDTDDFNDFGFGGSSSDEIMIMSKENMEKVTKHDTPVISAEKPMAPKAPSLDKVPTPIKSSPPNKRRKLDKPTSPVVPEKVLLKNRPDLMKEAMSVKVKQECKLVNNNHSPSPPGKLLNHSKKLNSVNKIKLTLKNSVLTKPKKTKASGVENNSENHRSKKAKKKDQRLKSIDLFNDSTINLPSANDNAKNDAKMVPQNNEKAKPDSISNHNSALSNHTPVINHVSIPEPNVTPIAVPLDVKSDVKNAKQPSQAVEQIVTGPKSVPTLKVALKSLNNSKYKSKSIIDSDDDISSLSSDSLDGFEDLLPKKLIVPKREVEKVSRRMFKTKAELKNPCPSSSPILSPVAMIAPPKVEKKKPKPALTTKIRIGKSSQSSSPRYSSPGSSKPPMKLKLPTSLHDPFNISGYSEITEPSLKIEEASYLSDRSISIPEKKPLVSTLKIPKIKIKIGGSHVNDQTLETKSATYVSRALTSPDTPTPRITIKLSESNVPKNEPYERKPEAPQRKKEPKESVKSKKPKEPKPIKVPKVKVVDHVKRPKIVPVPQQIPTTLDSSNDDHTVPTLLESTLVSETVVSETVVSETMVSETVTIPSSGVGEPIKIWYCPTCMLPDDGSPMVGCDKCDEWYHWPCVGLVQAPPDNLDWYCPPCVTKRKTTKKKPGKRKRKVP